MRATLWIAASGFLLASGSAYAGSEPSIGHDDTELAEAPPARRVDLSVPDQGARPANIASSANEARQTAAYDLSRMQPVEAVPQEQIGARSFAVTVDPAKPGGEFPWGG